MGCFAASEKMAGVYGRGPCKKEERTMVKVLSLLISVGLGLVIASQWADIQRYLKIKQMSQDDGHPENVPARGTAKYLQP
jgi:hypothetical protein